MLTFILNSTNAMTCIASRHTVNETKTCPRNQLEWNVRAKVYSCSSFDQRCVEPEKFLYHCVLNENGTGLVEVCAPAKYIHGKKINIFQ